MFFLLLMSKRSLWRIVGIVVVKLVRCVVVVILCDIVVFFVSIRIGSGIIVFVVRICMVRVFIVRVGCCFL